MLIVATPGKFHIKQDEIVGLIYPDVILPSLIKNRESVTPLTYVK